MVPTLLTSESDVRIWWKRLRSDFWPIGTTTLLSAVDAISRMPIRKRFPKTNPYCILRAKESKTSIKSMPLSR